MNGNTTRRLKPKILLVDLNNFARYPTLSIGYLASVLRNDSCEVCVYAPLMVGIQGTTREQRPHCFSLPIAKLNHLAATSRHAWIRRWRSALGIRRLSQMTLASKVVLDGLKSLLEETKPDVVMVSTYLMYQTICKKICALCQYANIPILIGGSYFSQPEVIENWSQIPGLTALVAGEIELELPSIVRTLIERGSPTKHIGLFFPSANGVPAGQVAPPLQSLDLVPFPDFSDFPWNLYPNRIVPIITGRGCSWGACTFCSDVTSSAGRRYRSRSPENVLDELAAQYRQFGIKRFVFTDLKLNSNLEMWRSIIEKIQVAVPGAQWIGAVHAGPEPDNGLSGTDLRAAFGSGCVRLTTGLESGSQRILGQMKKGVQLDTISAYLQAAASAGISNRCTMIIGYPGETAADVHSSADFLRQHTHEIDRVSLNRLQVITGTSLHRSMKQHPSRFKGIQIIEDDSAMALTKNYDYANGSAQHRKAVMRLLKEVKQINSRDMAVTALDFEGVM